jgi:hypothetical protein
MPMNKTVVAKMRDNRRAPTSVLRFAEEPRLLVVTRPGKAVGHAPHHSIIRRKKSRPGAIGDINDFMAGVTEGGGLAATLAGIATLLVAQHANLSPEYRKAGGWIGAGLLVTGLLFVADGMISEGFGFGISVNAGGGGPVDDMGPMGPVGPPVPIGP